MKNIWSDEEITKAISLIKEGKNYKDIATVLGRTKKAVTNKLNKIGCGFQSINPKLKDDCTVNEKFCSTCKEKKNKDEFNKNKKIKDGYNNVCRTCSNARCTQYYSENIEKQKKITINRSKLQKQFNRERLYEYYLEHPCVDCGEADPIVLESDHIDRKTKKSKIAKMVSSGLTWETILDELKKCETRCANCHRKRTAKQLNWYKWRISNK